MRINKERFLVLILFCVALLPVIMMRDFTPSNELRYLSIADEALRNHTFFAFTNHGAPYPDKPPLYIWLIMLCRWLTGEHYMWLLSMLSLLPAIGVVWVMDDWAKWEMSRESRIAAMLMTMTSGLFLVAAITIRMDMLMCLFITLALREFWFIYSRTGHYKRSTYLFPLYIFMAVFTKGPLGILIPLTSIGVFVFLDNSAGNGVRKKVRAFFHVWNWKTWSILAVLFSGWFGAVYAEGGSDFLNNMLFHQTMGRAVHAFHHQAPFYYYAIHIWYCLAPWSILIIGVFIYALRPKVMRSSLQRLFLTVALTTFVLLSLISSKLQIYMLPALPFFVYSASMFLPRFSERESIIKLSLIVPSIILMSSVVGLAVIYIYFGAGQTFHIAILLGGIILSLSGLHSLFLLWKKGQADTFGSVRAIGYGLLLAVFCAAWAMPAINKQIGYGNLCKQALALSKKHNITDFRTWRLHRSSNVDVYLESPVTVMEGDSLPQTNSGAPYLLLTRQKELSATGSRDYRVAGPYAVAVILPPR